MASEGTGPKPVQEPEHDGDAVAARLLRSLQRPSEPPVELRETHVSWVVLTADRAYKLKKPVRLAFVDQSTPERRRALCEEEVRINRPLAGEVILGVRGVVPVNSSYVLADADAPRAVDWVVEMRRFDESQTMAARLGRGELTEGQVAAVGARLAAFHEWADRIDHPLAQAVKEASDRNLEELMPLAAGILPARRLRAAQRLADAFVTARQEELDARAAAGRVVDGHGDLRAEHVLPAHDGVTVVDRLEFDARLRHVDVADDLAFLVMDLEALGGRWAADLLVDRYRAAGGDPGDDALIAFFAAYRAQVRVKVELLRGRKPAADHLLDVGEQFAWRARAPLLLVVTGPPASGKSTVARAIAGASGLPVYSSDEIRNELVPSGTPDRYGSASRRRVYEELGRRAAEGVHRRAGAVADATFGEAATRDAFLQALGDEARTAVRVIECQAPRQVLLDRAARRAAAGTDASEAGPAVAARLLDAFTPMDLPVKHRLVVETSGDVGELVDRVATWLDETLISSQS